MAASELLSRSSLIGEWKREDQTLAISVLLLVIAGDAGKKKEWREALGISSAASVVVLSSLLEERKR